MRACINRAGGGSRSCKTVRAWASVARPQARPNAPVSGGLDNAIAGASDGLRKSTPRIAGRRGALSERRSDRLRKPVIGCREISET